MDNNYINEEYSRIIEDLKEEITEGYISENENLYVVRQSHEENLNGNKITPVVDFFFEMPALSEKMSKAKVVDVKKGLFEMVAALPEDADPNIKEALNMHINCLKDYTSQNSKRNDKVCTLVVAEESGLPMAIYFEEDEVADTLTRMTAKDLLAELEETIA